jgi:tRNA/rRNA methyltransferase
MAVETTVVLLRPKEDGNVGAVARAMSNFGSSHLVIVSPRAPLGEEARRRAMAGLPILKAATVVSTIEEAILDADIVVGTTDLSTGRTRSYLRRSVSPQDWGRILGGIDGKVAILFGPEDNGLAKEELELCDLLVYIPTHPSSPTLNLSHAVAVLLYETFLGLESPPHPRPEAFKLNGKQKAVFFELLERALVESNYPKHKRRSVVLLFRRLLGRATTSEYEYAMMLGFVKRMLRKSRARNSDDRT